MVALTLGNIEVKWFPELDWLCLNNLVGIICHCRVEFWLDDYLLLYLWLSSLLREQLNWFINHVLVRNSHLWRVPLQVLLEETRTILWLLDIYLRSINWSGRNIYRLCLRYQELLRFIGPTYEVILLFTLLDVYLLNRILETIKGHILLALDRLIFDWDNVLSWLSIERVIANLLLGLVAYVLWDWIVDHFSWGAYVWLLLHSWVGWVTCFVISNL